MSTNQKSLRRQRIILTRMKDDWLNNMIGAVILNLELADSEPNQPFESLTESNLYTETAATLRSFVKSYEFGGPKFFSMQRDGIADENEWEEVANDPECQKLFAESERIIDGFKKILEQTLVSTGKIEELTSQIKKNLELERARLGEKLTEVEEKIREAVEGQEGEITSRNKQ